MWIDHVSEDRATGLVGRIYRSIRRSWGGVDNVIKVHSLQPEAMRALMIFYRGVMHGDRELSLKQREMIAVTVSGLGVELEDFWERGLSNL